MPSCNKWQMAVPLVRELARNYLNEGIQEQLETIADDYDALADRAAKRLIPP
jgi:hypothetical protein